MEKDPFKEYLQDVKPTKKELGYSWYTAIGLQKVDGLDVSEYLKSVAIDNVDGNITIEKAEKLINSYYAQAENHQSDTEEADIDEEISIESENVELKEKKNNKVGLITIATVVISFIILSSII